MSGLKFAAYKFFLLTPSTHEVCEPPGRRAILERHLAREQQSRRHRRDPQNAGRRHGRDPVKGAAVKVQYVGGWSHRFQVRAS